MLCKERNLPDETELLYPRTSGLRNLSLGEMHPVKQQMFEITSKIIFIRLLIQHHGN